MPQICAENGARIFQLFKGIDSKESIPPAHVAWHAARYDSPIPTLYNCYKIPAQPDMAFLSAIQLKYSSTLCKCADDFQYFLLLCSYKN
jgi:hypothetical protein